MTSLDDLLTPPTATAERALETVRAMADDALVNHSLRSYAWGAALARTTGITYDPELLFVAAMLHDLGVTPLFDAHAAPFEDAGGAVGWIFAAAAGWPVERRERVREVIQRHMWPAVDPAFDAEGHLLEVATSFDVRGAGSDAWDASLVARVVRRVPRLDFSASFELLIEAQAERKPESHAHRLHRADGVRAGAAWWAERESSTPRA